MNNIIIFGSKGQIGQYLSNELNKSNNIYLFDLPKYDIFKKDFLKKVYKTIDKKKEYIVINCIGLMGADDSKKKPEKFYYINGFAPVILLSLQKKIKIKKFIHLSSETIYGPGKNILEDSKSLPMHPYAISKLVSEINLSNYYKFFSKKLCLVMLRLPVIVFQTQKHGNTLSIILKSMITNKTIEIYGNGRHKRKYLHVEDLGRVIKKIISKKFRNSFYKYNLPGNILNTMEIIKIAEKILNKKFKTKFIQSNKSFDLYSNSKKLESEVNVELFYNKSKLVEKLLTK